MGEPTLNPLLTLGTLLSTVIAASVTVSLDFDSDAAGALPPGWRSAMTGEGTSPRWAVIKDQTAPSPPNVLAQLSETSSTTRLPLAILDRVTCRDGDLSVKFKPVSGRLDQSGGLVWRFRDPNNYYVVRANALEDNIVLYKIEKGRRSSIAPKGTPPQTYGVRHKVPPKAWSTLRVRFEGPHFVVIFNGEELFEVEDRTFSEPGNVGLWTKTDSVTHFDDFQVSGD
jgi:hypothetical protein